MGYEVHTPVFEGPVDLLLHLALREELEICDVSLVQIVDGFLVYLARMPDLDLGVTTEFLLVAATLVELKSQRLLPDAPEVDVDDDLAPWEERDLLFARVLECRTFAAAAAVFDQLAQAADRSFPRAAGIDDRFLSVVPDLLHGMTSERLRDAFLNAVAPRPAPTVDLGHVTAVKVSVVDAVAALTAELPRLGRTTFRRLTQGLGAPVEVIVRFLALLELYRQGLVELDQRETFGEISVGWTGSVAEPVTRVLVDLYEG